MPVCALIGTDGTITYRPDLGASDCVTASGVMVLTSDDITDYQDVDWVLASNIYGGILGGTITLWAATKGAGQLLAFYRRNMRL